MRCVVFAYSQVGVQCLRALLQAGVEVALVVTHRDDPSETLWFDSVAELAEAHAISVVAPEEVNRPDWIARTREARPEALFSFYYRRLLCREILDLPSIGAFNMHGSLLPAYRGRCPVNWVLVHGETRTGVTLHEMIEKPDAGPIVAQHEIEIAPEDDALSLSRKIADEAARLLENCLPGLRRGAFPRTVQRLEDGSYFGGRTPEDGRIDWSRPAGEIHNLVRAVADPWPGAFTDLDGRRLTVWRSDVDFDEGSGPPGCLEQADPPTVRCGEHRLILRRWSLEIEKGSNKKQSHPKGVLRRGLRLG